MTKDELLALGIDDEVCEKILEDADLIKSEYEKKIDFIKRDNEIEIALRESGARNIKAVRALIDTEGDIKEQIARLKAENDTKFLFEGGRRSFEPGKSSERLPDTGRGDFEARLSEARKKGDTIGAIRIKQQAAQNGIVLI